MTTATYTETAPSPDARSADAPGAHQSEASTDLGIGRRMQFGVRRWLGSHRWPLIVTCCMFALGGLVLFGWDPLIGDPGHWFTGGDLWGIFRAAHYVGWGSLSGVYAPGNGVVSFPGMPVLLAPVAMLSGSLHLTESYGPFTLARPTAALLLAPVEMLAAATVVFAADALAATLGTTRRNRVALCWLVGLMASPVAAVWGHAEDMLAVTFALYALGALFDGRWARSGWLIGFGVAVQPLVLLLVPLFIGASPAGQRLRTAVRSVLVSAFLVGVAFAGEASDTWRSIVVQPTPPSVNHATPWISLAPVVSRSTVQRVQFGVPRTGLGHTAFTVATSGLRSAAEVSGGPGRMIDVALAVLVGVFLWRRPQTPIRVGWLAAAVLVSRCFFEAVMTPYYVVPPLILALLLVSVRGGRRLAAASVLAAGMCVYAYFHLAPWVWWSPIVVGLAAVLALGYPRALERSQPKDRVAEGRVPAGIPDSHPGPGSGDHGDSAPAPVSDEHAVSN